MADTNQPIDTKQNVKDIYENVKAQKKFIFVVFFRGHWCPFCMAYLSELESIRAAVYQRGGAIMVVTAEEESKLEPVREIFHGYMFSDPTHILADHLAQANLIQIAKTPRDGYVQGVAQPGVLVMQGDKQLYSWAIVPSLANLGGAKDRPSLIQIKDNVFAQLDGRPVPNETIDTQTFWQGIRFKLFGAKKEQAKQVVDCK